jgi:hypothetical protein
MIIKSGEIISFPNFKDENAIIPLRIFFSSEKLTGISVYEKSV